MNDSIYIITYMVNNIVGENIIHVPYNILAEERINDTDLTKEYNYDDELKSICNEILNNSFSEYECMILKIKRIF